MDSILIYKKNKQTMKSFRGEFYANASLSFKFYAANIVFPCIWINIFLKGYSLEAKTAPRN